MTTRFPGFLERVKTMFGTTFSWKKVNDIPLVRIQDVAEAVYVELSKWSPAAGSAVTRESLRAWGKNDHSAVVENKASDVNDAAVQALLQKTVAASNVNLSVLERYKNSMAEKKGSAILGGLRKPNDSWRGGNSPVTLKTVNEARAQMGLPPVRANELRR